MSLSYIPQNPYYRIQMNGFDGFNNSCPSNYNTAQSTNSINPQQSIYSPVTDVQSSSDSEEPSLIGQCKSNVAIFGGIKAIPHVLHPINSWNAIQATNAIFKNNAALNALTPLQQGEAYRKLFNAARLQPRVLKQGIRTADEAQKIATSINDIRHRYIEALKAKDMIKAADLGAQLATVTGKGTKRLFRGVKTYKEITDAALASGAEAAKLAKGTQVATTALKGASTAQKIWGTGKMWFKESGGWIAVALESIGEIPELIAAYSQGKSGDGIKQTAKSATKVAINTAGWIAGAKVGAIAGTKLGAIIGSAFPGAGTAIGAAVGGFLGGIIGMATGSWASGKVSKAVVGKSFREKQAESLALQTQGTPQTVYQNDPSLNNPYMMQNINYYS